ncbi:hypothetical protein LA52FAK_26570 [Desulforhopalus sp. 52FAK]
MFFETLKRKSRTNVEVSAAFYGTVNGRDEERAVTPRILFKNYESARPSSSRFLTPVLSYIELR